MRVVLSMVLIVLLFWAVERFGRWMGAVDDDEDDVL